MEVSLINDAPWGRLCFKSDVEAFRRAVGMPDDAAGWTGELDLVGDVAP